MVYADSSAALAIAKRKGAGKIRHINISCLWIQERADSKELEMRKVLGTENPADMMTKHLARQPLDKCMMQLNQHRATGRAKTGLQIQGAGSAKANPTGSPSAPAGGAEELRAAEMIEDDWRTSAVAHRVLDRPWRGETEFELSTGEWKSCVHHGWRRALMTPERVKVLKLPRGAQWTGKRRTTVREYSDDEFLGSVRFQPAEIVMVPSWKGLNREMNYRPQRAQCETLRVDIDKRDRFKAQRPSVGSSGIRLNSLQICLAEPSQAPSSRFPTVADEQPDQATIFQDGGQRHNRRGAENIGVRESTRPPVDWPGRNGYIRRRVLRWPTSFAAFDVDQSSMQVGTTHNKLENKHRKLCNCFFYYSG